MGEDLEKGSESTIKKKVDETWKNSVDKEKEGEDLKGPGPAEPPPPDFTFFISALGMQVLLALGEIPDESGVRTAADLKQAQYLIDVIQMLSDKTKGNLTETEGVVLENLLYELRIKFVQKTQNK
jgi:hypothetical protein